MLILVSSRGLIDTQSTATDTYTYLTSYRKFNIIETKDCTNFGSVLFDAKMFYLDLLGRESIQNKIYEAFE